MLIQIRFSTFTWILLILCVSSWACLYLLSFFFFFLWPTGRENSNLRPLLPTLGREIPLDKELVGAYIFSLTKKKIIHRMFSVNHPLSIECFQSSHQSFVTITISQTLSNFTQSHSIINLGRRNPNTPAALSTYKVMYQWKPPKFVILTSFPTTKWFLFLFDLIPFHLLGLICSA